MPYYYAPFKSMQSKEVGRNLNFTLSQFINEPKQNSNTVIMYTLQNR